MRPRTDAAVMPKPRPAQREPLGAPAAFILGAVIGAAGMLLGVLLAVAERLS